jgi:transposase-like protein
MSRQRKRDAVLRLLRGEDLEMASRSLGVTAAALTAWRDTFLAAGEAGLATRPADGEALESERLKARLGEMLLERETAGSQDRRLGGRAPFGPAAVEAMSRTASPSGAKPYGLARVCRVWRVARPPSTGTGCRRPPSRRGVPARSGPMADAALVEAIRAVLAASPFHGEGHRKVLGQAAPRRRAHLQAPGAAADGACTGCSPPRGSARPAARATTTAPSSPRRWTRCGAPT